MKTYQNLKKIELKYWTKFYRKKNLIKQGKEQDYNPISIFFSF